MNPKIGRMIGRFVMTFKKNLPEITAGLSALGVIGTAVLSARSAYKSVPKLEEHREKMEQLHAAKDCFDDPKEYNKEVLTVYKDTGVEMVKSYWPAGVAVMFTLAGIFTSNSLHRKRYFGMAGLCSTIMAAYNEYRERVRDQYGEDAERDLYLGIKREEVVTVETDKKGKEKTKTEIVVKPGEVDNPNFDVYLIDRNDKCWYYNRPELTYYYLLETQNCLTQMLRTRGYLFLNEVLRSLNKPECPEGQIIGWIYDENKGDTDNCVDFGLAEGTENFDLFMSGKNEYVYITLNHDGTIYDKFPFFDRIWGRKSTRRV